MKIIVKGEYNAYPWTGRWSCIRCKSVWELGVNDKVEYHAATDQRDDSYYYMNCPVCGEKCTRLPHR